LRRRPAVERFTRQPCARLRWDPREKIRLPSCFLPSTNQGVPSFEYNQASRNQPFLSNFLKLLDSLAAELLERFAGKRMTMLDVYDRHQVDTPFIELPPG
jgi:hypothetical protein